MGNFDCVCIGSGPGGYSAAIQLSKLGKKVAVIDYSKDNIGGVCLNEGCIPVKSIIKAAKLYSQVKEKGDELGLNIQPGKPEIEKITSYAKNNARSLRKGVQYLFNKYNIKFIEAEASLLSKHEIEIITENDREKIKAENIILATGSLPNELPNLKFDKKRVLSSFEAINLDYLPKEILIIGTGAIGIEFAGIFNCLGSKVLISEIKERILPEEDEDISSELEKLYKKRGIDIYTQCNFKVLGNKKDKIRIELKGADFNKTIQPELILLAVGRYPNVNKDNLAKIGIETDKKGFVKVDEFMRTTVENIYAIGDITSYPMLAHAAYKEAEIASLDICKKNPQRLNPLNIPTVVYSDIEVASIGLTENEAESQGLKYKIYKQSFKSNPKAVVSDFKDGFIKIIVDEKTHKFLGVHIIGHEASELIHQFAICRENDLTIDRISKTIYAHPTFSEAVREVSSGFLGKSFHR